MKIISPILALQTALQHRNTFDHRRQFRRYCRRYIKGPRLDAAHGTRMVLAGLVRAWENLELYLLDGIPFGVIDSGIGVRIGTLRIKIVFEISHNLSR